MVPRCVGHDGELLSNEQQLAPSFFKVRIWDTSKGDRMSRKRYTAEQIIGHLRQAEIRTSTRSKQLFAGHLTVAHGSSTLASENCILPTSNTED